MCIFVCIFYINNTAKGNTSLMLNKLLLLHYFFRCGWGGGLLKRYCNIWVYFIIITILFKPNSCFKYDHLKCINL